MLSKKTKYGIKALTYIGRYKGNTPVQISVISEAEHIPHKFLESILLQLKQKDFLASKKGKGGGYFLNMLAKDILMTEVYRALEGPIAMMPCVSLNYYEKCKDCKDENTCAVNKLMVQVRDSTLDVLKDTSLEDLL